MKLNNMKIGVRLGLGFGAVLLLLVAITMMSVSSLSKVNDNMEKIVQLNYAKIKLASDAQKTLRKVVGDIKSMLIVEPGALKDLKAEIELNRALGRGQVHRALRFAPQIDGDRAAGRPAGLGDYREAHERHGL